jgi:hypothetical protein
MCMSGGGGGGDICSNSPEKAAEGNIFPGKRGKRHHKRQGSKGRVRGGKGRQQNPPFGVAKLGLGASMSFGLPVSEQVR